MSEIRLRTKSELKKLFTNLRRKLLTDNMFSILIDTLWRDLPNLRTSGFDKPGGTDSVITWNNTLQTFTISPFDPQIENWLPRFGIYTLAQPPAVYHRLYTDYAIQIPNQEGLYLIYFAASEETQLQELKYIKNPTEIQENKIYTTEIIVAWIYFDATHSKAIYFGNERHGSEWNPQIHGWADSAFNGLLVEGMKLTNLPGHMLNNGYDGTLDRDAQIGLTQGRWLHEDIEISQPALAITDGIPVFWKELIAGVKVPRLGGEPNFPVHVVSGHVCINPSGNGLQHVNDANYFLMHFFATNCTLYPVVGWMGRSQHQWIEECYFAAEAELETIKSEITQKTWLHLGTVVFQASQYFPIDAKCRLVGLVTPEAVADLKAIDKAVFVKHGWMPNILPAWYNHPETPLLLTSVQGEGDFYYWDGEKTEAESSYGIGFDDEYGMQYGIMDQILGIVGVNTPWRLDAVDKLMFGAFFWNPDQQKRLYMGYNMYSYELHPNERFQRYFNKATNHISGLVATINETLGKEHTVNVTDGEIQSVDITANITNGNIAGGWGQEMQYLKASKYFLQTDAELRWRIENAIAENVVILDDDNEVVYNQLDGTDYKLTPTADGDYIAMWLVASMDYLNPLKLICGTQVTANLEEARTLNSANTLQALFDATEFFCLEYVVVARIIAKNIAEAPFYELIEIETYKDGDFEQLTNDRHVTDMLWDAATKTLTLKRNDNLPDLVKVLSGIDGREVEFQENAGYVEWRYVGGLSWTQLFEIPVPADGEPGAPGKDGITPHIGENGNWYIGETDTGVKAAGTNGNNGINGRTPEFSTSGGYVVWRYTGDITWNNLFLIPSDGADGSDGANGADGVPIELRENAGWVEWRYVGAGSWTQLYEIPEGTGEGTDEKVKINAEDATAGYLEDKLAAGDGITIEPGTGENAGKLVITNTGGGGGEVTVITAGDDIEVYIDFEDALPYTYSCPKDMRFIELEYESNEPALSVALNTPMSKYDDLVVTPDGTGLVILRGKIETAFIWEVYIDFDIIEAQTYKCPYPVRFESMDHEQANTPEISPALNTNLSKYQVVTITPDAVGLVSLIGIKL